MGDRLIASKEVAVERRVPDGSSVGRLASDPSVPGRSAAPRSMETGAVLAWLLGLGLVVLAAALLRYEPPQTVRLPWVGIALPETCNARSQLGIDCPGCGLTRSFILAADGAWVQAWQMHPVGTVGFLFCAALIPLRLWQGLRLWWGGKPRSTVVAEIWVIVGLMVASVVWWGIKSIGL